MLVVLQPTQATFFRLYALYGSNRTDTLPLQGPSNASSQALLQQSFNLLRTLTQSSSSARQQYQVNISAFRLFMILVTAICI
jgi:hypothetical protein